MKRLTIVALAVLLCGAGVAWLRPDDPVQVMIDSNAPSFSRAGWTIHALATYDISARVLHKKRYYYGEAADLAPYDFAVGWGPMSDSTVLRLLKISQGNRFYFYEYPNAPPIPQDQIICHSANMHLVPATAAVHRALWWASPGNVIRMTGYLIEARRPNWSVWRSSLSRTDTGNGACELMWVESCVFLPGKSGA